MQTRDTQSDFLLIDRVAKPHTPFEMRYHSETQAEGGHTATFDGATYDGCLPLAEGYILVPISAGALAEGRLQVRRHFHAPHEAFKDDQRLNHRYTERTDLRLRPDAPPSQDVAFAFEADAWLSAKAFTALAAQNAESSLAPSANGTLSADDLAALERLKARIANL